MAEKSCANCIHHSEGDPSESEVVEVLPECKYDESDEEYMEALFDEFDNQGETGDMDEFLGTRCKYYEKRV